MTEIPEHLKKRAAKTREKAAMPTGVGLGGRLLHPSTAQILSFFEFGHLPDPLRQVSRHFYEFAHTMVETLEEGPELTVGLRKLLEAKDCFVRQAVAHGVRDVG